MKKRAGDTGGYAEKSSGPQTSADAVKGTSPPFLRLNRNDMVKKCKLSDFF